MVADLTQDRDQTRWRKASEPEGRVIAGWWRGAVRGGEQRVLGAREELGGGQGFT